MQYGEIGGRSNGRAIQRSEDAGVNFTDMTIDTNGVSLHPDQHAIASTPFNPNIVFIGNDGGIWRLRRLVQRRVKPVCIARIDRQQPDRLQ